MENWNGATWIQKARGLTRDKEKLKISAIHAGVTVGAALVITLAQLVLSTQIEKTSGLSGLGMRSILQTIETVLQTANLALMPFWDLGFLFVGLLWARECAAAPRDLLAGFRRCGPYLRLMLLQGLLVFLGGVACAYVSSFIFMMTPWAGNVMEFAQSVGMDMTAASQAMAQMDAAAMEALMAAMQPMLIIWGILGALVLIPMLYRFRMAGFLILDGQPIGAIAAMVLSSRMLRRRRFKLFLLDLRLWWYYGLQMFCTVFYLAELWLPMLGISLPVSSETAGLIFYMVYLLSIFAVQTLLRPQVAVTYAQAYEYLRQGENVLPKVLETPKNLPWDEA